MQFPLKITGDFERPLIFFQVYPADETFKSQISDTTEFVEKMQIGLEIDTLVQEIARTNWSTDSIPAFSISIKPNPTNNFCVIDLESRTYENLFWSLANDQGEVLIHKQKISGDFNLDLTNYSAGIYYLAVHTAEKITTYKIVRL